MAEKVRDVMTKNPTVLGKDLYLSEAAREMKRGDIGDVVVVDDGALYGIVTDRDIVIRAIAENRDPTQTRLGDIASTNLVTVGPDDDVKDAIALMKRGAIRRIPVVDGGAPVGIVTLGDLAQERHPSSVLGQISAAPPQH